MIDQTVEAFLATRISYLEELSAAVESVETQPTYSADDVFDCIHGNRE